MRPPVSEYSGLGRIAPREPVGEEHQHEAHDRLIQPDGRRPAVVGERTERAEHVGVYNVRRGIQQGVVADKGIDHAEIALEYVAYAHDEHQNDDVLDERQRDFENTAELARPVDPGGLVNALVYAENGSHVDDRAPPRALPQTDDDEGRGPYVGRGIKGNGRAAERSDGVVDHAVGTEKRHRKERHRRPGNEVGQRHQRLRGLDEPPFVEFAHHDGDHQRTDRSRYDEQGVQIKRVERYLDPGGTGKEKAEVFQPRPRACEHARDGIEVLKRDDHADHRKISEYDNEKQSGQKQQVTAAVFHDVGAFQPYRKTLFAFLRHFNVSMISEMLISAPQTNLSAAP